MKHHLQTYELIPEEQIGGVSNKQGTIDQLLTNNNDPQPCEKKQRHLDSKTQARRGQSTISVKRLILFPMTG